MSDCIWVSGLHTSTTTWSPLDKCLARATKLTEKSGGGILVVSEGVFGMRGDQGDIKGIVALKEKYDFRILIDDAHGFGVLGPNGEGACEEQGVTDGVDVYFATFAKSFASIGAFLAGDPDIMEYLKYNMRSQIFAKSLPMPLVLGNQRRFELMKEHPEFKENLWNIVNKLQAGLKERGFNIGNTTSCVTPVFLDGTPFEASQLVYDHARKLQCFLLYGSLPNDSKRNNYPSNDSNRITYRTRCRRYTQCIYSP